MLHLEAICPPTPLLKGGVVCREQETTCESDQHSCLNGSLLSSFTSSFSPLSDQARYQSSSRDSVCFSASSHLDITSSRRQLWIGCMRPTTSSTTNQTRSYRCLSTPNSTHQPEKLEQVSAARKKHQALHDPTAITPNSDTQ